MTRGLRCVVAVVTTVFACGVAPAAAFAQAQGASPSSGSTTFIPAIVTDRQGSSVTGLDQNAFAVREGDRSLPITSFSVESGPVSLVLVVDASLSVGDTEDANARESIRRLVQSTHPQSEFFVTGVAGRVWSVGWTRDRANVTSVLDELTRLRRAALRDRTGLPTPLHDGILRALEAAEQSRYRKRAVVIISDGMDTNSRAPRKDVEGALRRTSAVVYLMTLRGSSPGIPREVARRIDTSDTGLRRFVDETGGRAFNVEKAGDWAGAADRISADLQHVYVIGVSPEVSRRGWRKVSVSLASPPGDGTTVRSRTGYMIPRP
jgi:Ca-activated chloride channel family protein